ncbi:hypothetical protein K8352_06725 [Flavobacteriaceae bacterium F89]|uniref:PHP domain-containing protein n=1 Tax=Cerina litoralis TaxID=2874477 RepID=A0AAE3EU12_9FLAO|nr:hypothetical protein [Cerina litoralis]MCG2460435.1 hypothetical protein [Cerina litoralis]
MKKGKFKHITTVAPLVFILVLATAFHYEVHLTNALTSLPATDFGVKVPFWRIFFEPFLGPLLFFNRSIYALKELPLALLWLLIFYLAWVGVRIFRKGEQRKTLLLNQLANVPLLLGICFSIFVLILFVPLPNNKIVNNSAHSVLVTTHDHTEFSHDGLISEKGMWKWHKRNGFDAFFITDHANHKKTLRFVQAQRNGEFPIEPLVMVGQEYSGSNHMSLLGLNGKFQTKGLTDKMVVDSVHKYGGAVIINHWFDGKGKEKEFYRDLGVDGFEIENVGSDLYYDRGIFVELKEFCEENNLMMVGGLDFHGYGRVSSIYNAFEIPNWDSMGPGEKEHAILGILKHGPQEKLRVLLYKDRPFYLDSNLIFRPFLTLINYFRTLNYYQVLSWFIWLVLLRLIWREGKKRKLDGDKIMVWLSCTCSLFLLAMALSFYLREEAVKGYNEIYAEYFGILGPIGLVLLIYVLILAYFRFIRTPKKSG